MTDPKIIEDAGKRIAATASGRAYKEVPETPAAGGTSSDEERPKNREVEDEMIKVPAKDGQPPKPATEPNR